MKPPPLLLGATLLFWGWQSGFLVVGAILGVILESARVTKTRWEFSDEDFSRVWTFCALLLLASALYAFTANEGPSSFGGFFSDANHITTTRASSATARTTGAMMRWLPMIFFPFLAAQTFSTREAIPLTIINLIARRRWKKPTPAEKALPSDQRSFHIGYPYFAATLFASSFHPAEDNSFFWGLVGLLIWMLWAHRTRRVTFGVWIGLVALVIGFSFAGQRGIGRLASYLQELNPQLLARFLRRNLDPSHSRTAIGQLGDIKTSGRIVIRLQPKPGSAPPEYLREASYRVFKSPGWFAGNSRDDFELVAENPPNSGSWPLLPGKTNPASINIACYLDNVSTNGSRQGLLPLPTGSGRLENLPAYVLRKNSAGTVVAEGPGVVLFDALFGPGLTMDAPPSVSPGTNDDLTVSEAEQAALDAVIEELQLRGKPPAQVLPAVAGYFASKFTYSTWQGRDRGAPGTTALSRFLRETRKGHCEYFATATVLLLRRLEIPARYAVGYAVHETSGSGYVVRLSDAHAWCLVWNQARQTWEDFDTTPASWVAEEAKNRSPFRWLSDVWSRLTFEFSKFRWGQSKLRQYLLWIVVPGLVLLLYQIIFRRGRRRQAGKKADPAFITQWPGLDSEFYQLETQIAGRGVPRRPSEPLNEWLQRVVQNPVLVGLQEPLRALLRLHYRYRFDPPGLSDADREMLKRETRLCLDNLNRAKPSQKNH